ncbi:MAG: hypothetical protein ABI651_21830, partial [Verrucomicrobiota bacterium]
AILDSPSGRYRPKCPNSSGSVPLAEAYVCEYSRTESVGEDPDARVLPAGRRQHAKQTPVF